LTAASFFKKVAAFFGHGFLEMRSMMCVLRRELCIPFALVFALTACSAQNGGDPAPTPASTPSSNSAPIPSDSNSPPAPSSVPDAGNVENPTPNPEPPPAGESTMDAGVPASSAFSGPPPFFLLHWADTQLGSGSHAEPFFTYALDVVYPAFGGLVTVVSGDLVENGSEEDLWVQYMNMVDGAGLTADRYIDAPGNHDSLLDSDLSHYQDYSVAGRAGMGTFGITEVYEADRHIRVITVNTAAAGDPVRDGAGYVDGDEIQEILAAIDESTLEPDHTLVVGHHPMNLPDALMLFGTDDELEELLVATNATAYLFGHHHFYMSYWFGETLMTQASTIGNPAEFDFQDQAGFSLFAIDDQGPVVKNIDILGPPENPHVQWPVVMITSPGKPALAQDLDPTAMNPFASGLPRNSTHQMIRAGAFAPGGIDEVVVTINGGPSMAMNRVGQHFELAIDTPDADSFELVVAAFSGGYSQSKSDSFTVPLY
jgi:hypothetical protein